MKKTAKKAPKSYIKAVPDDYNPPKYDLESLARCLYPAMVAYFESDDGKREFAEWKEQQARTQ